MLSVIAEIHFFSWGVKRWHSNEMIHFRQVIVENKYADFKIRCFDFCWFRCCMLRPNGICVIEMASVQSAMSKWAIPFAIQSIIS